MNPIAEIIPTGKGRRIYVDEFKCSDGGMMEKLGQHAREAEWKVVTGSKEPVRVKVHEDSGLIHSKKVSVEVSDGKTAELFKVWPYKGETAKLTEPVSHTWTFQGENPNKDLEDYFEAKPWYKDAWVPCILRESNPDDTHTVDLILTLPNGLTKLERAENVPSSEIREVGSHTPLSNPPRVLRLKVPVEDPVHGVKLYLDDKDITSALSRPTPPKRADKIKFVVSKDREKITCDYGHDVIRAQKDSLLHMLEKGGADDKISKDSKTWKFRVGAFGDHDVQIHRKGTKHIDLSVDGVLLVSASAEDLGKDEWRCGFDLTGKPEFVFQVHKQNLDGVYLSATSDETVKLQAARINCEVVVPYMKDLTESQLFLNGQEIKTLPFVADGIPQRQYTEKSEMHPHAFNTQYDLVIPHCVDDKAPVGLAAVSLEIPGQGGSLTFKEWLSKICPFCTSVPSTAPDANLS